MSAERYGRVVRIRHRVREVDRVIPDPVVRNARHVSTSTNSHRARAVEVHPCSAGVDGGRAGGVESVSNAGRSHVAGELRSRQAGQARAISNKLTACCYVAGGGDVAAVVDAEAFGAARSKCKDSTGGRRNH